MMQIYFHGAPKDVLHWKNKIEKLLGEPLRPITAEAEKLVQIAAQTVENEDDDD
jgi:hypothetical protein